MKKNIFKLVATAMALAIVLAPTTSITSQAAGLGFNAGNHDDTDYGDRPSGGGSSDSGDNKSNDSGSSNESAPAPKVEGNSGSSNSGGSGSSDSGSDNSFNEHGFNANAHDDTDYGDRPSSGTANYWTTSNPNDVPVKVTGGQTFRSVMNKEHTVYQVYHMGISQASFAVTDAKGNKVAFSTVTLEKGEDGLWYENITLAEGVDAKGLTVTVTAGDATYLSTTLGVSGIKLNGEVVLSTVPETNAK